MPETTPATVTVEVRHGRAEPVVGAAGATVAEVVATSHDSGVDRALARWPGLTREGLEPVLSYCAERRCEAANAFCGTCRLATLKAGLDAIDDLVARYREIRFRETGLRLEAKGEGTREEESLQAFADRWRGEEHWFLARRVIRKLQHGPRRARDLVTAVETVGDTPSMILMEPQMAANVGMVARAMANFGLDQLRVINPRDGWPSEKARILASGASAIVDGAGLYPTLTASIADLNWVCATTARQRELVKPVLTPEQAAAEMHKRIALGQKVGVLFGRERNGLQTGEVANCDAIVMIPVNSSFASLNLAQAVLLLGYEWLKQTGAATLGRVTTYEERIGEGLRIKRGRPATRAELDGFFGQLEEALATQGFLYPPDKTPTMVQNIRTMFLRMEATEQEVRTLRGIVAALVKGKARPRGTP